MGEVKPITLGSKIMTRQKKQELLIRLDKAVNLAVKKDPNVKLVVRYLSRYIDGVNIQHNNWVFEHCLFIQSRLIKKWFEMSMDLSI